MIDTDGDGDFTTGPITYVAATSIVGTDAFFDNVDFEDEEVFTIGYGDFTPPTASNPATITVCDTAPAPDVTVVTDEDDDCTVDTVTHIGDVSDGLSNPETITRTYRITDTSGNFTDVVQLIEVYTTPDAGANNIVNICVDDTIDLFASLGGMPDMGGSWNDDDMTMVSLVDPTNVDFTGIAVGMYNFTYTVIAVNPICPDDAATVTVVINQPPTVDAGSSEEICEGDTFDFSTSFTPPSEANSSSLSWASSGDGSFDNSTALLPVYTPGPTDLGNVVTLTLTAFGIGSCPDVLDSMELNIRLAPMVDAGSDEEVCQGDTYDLSTSSMLPSEANSSSRSWSAAGDGSFDNNTLLHPIYTPGATDIANGSVVLTLMANGNGSCPSVQDTMTLTITPAPKVNAGSDENICQGDTHDLSTSTTIPSALDFSSLLWSTGGDGMFSNVNVLHPIYTPGAADIIAGSVVLTLTVNGNGVCPPAQDAMILTIDSQPVADAGLGGDVCDIANPFATSAAPAIGTGTWTNLSPGVGTAIFADLNDETTTVTVDAYGTYTFRWTDDNGTCSDFDEIIVNFYENPTIANAGPDIDQCANGDFVMAVNAPGVGTGIWSEVGGPAGITITNPNSPTTTVTGLAAGSSATLRWTISNGSCPDSFDEMVITNDLEPTVADAGPDIAQCNNGDFVMEANTPVVGTGTWTQESGPAVITLAPNSPTATFTGLPAGSSATLRWTISNGSCTDSFDDMIITNDIQPMADAGSGGNVCDIANPFATGATPAMGTGTWTNQSLGVGTAIFANPNDETTTVTVDAYGTYTFRWTDDNGTCSDFDEIIVNFYENPTIADAGPDIAQCNNGDFVMAANAPRSWHWHMDPAEWPRCDHIGPEQSYGHFHGPSCR